VLYLGMQAAGPPHLPSTVMAQHLSRMLRIVAALLLLVLAALAVAGASTTMSVASTNAYESDPEMGSDGARAAEMRPLTSGQPLLSADGEILTVGSRVQTQHTVVSGGDGSWYAGTIVELHAADETATVIYDDGEEWLARLRDIYQLRGEEDDVSTMPPAAPQPAGSSAAVTAVAPHAGVPVAHSSAPVAVGAVIGSPQDRSR